MLRRALMGFPRGALCIFFPTVKTLSKAARADGMSPLRPQHSWTT